MARLRITEPPKLAPGSSYGKYKPWLLDNFHRNICSYCLTQHRALEIDHYEPTAFAPQRENDPSNLLLACRFCNRNKSDYHPLHGARHRDRNETHGFLVIDVRAEDYAEFYALDEASGELRAKPGAQQDRAAWNAYLLGLDHDNLARVRGRLLEKLALCEALMEYPDDDETVRETCRVLLRDCSENYLLFEAFDIGMSEHLRGAIREHRDQNRNA
jgi:hypothetical protein